MLQRHEHKVCWIPCKATSNGPANISESRATANKKFPRLAVPIKPQICTFVSRKNFNCREAIKRTPHPSIDEQGALMERFLFNQPTASVPFSPVRIRMHSGRSKAFTSGFGCRDLVAMLMLSWIPAVCYGKKIEAYLSDVAGDSDCVFKLYLLAKLHAAQV